MKALTLAVSHWDVMNTFYINVNGERVTCSLIRTAGVYWARSAVACRYTSAPLESGDVVLIDGAQYRVRVIGDDCEVAIFDKVASMRITEKALRAHIEELNEQIGVCVGTSGAFQLESAYGGHKVVRNLKGGGSREITVGYDTPRNVIEALRGRSGEALAEQYPIIREDGTYI